MYTFNRVIKDEKDVSKRRRVVLVEFKDEKQSVLERDMQFSIDATDVEVKRAFKAFLDELNFVPVPISDLDVPVEETPSPTQAELDKAAWDLDVARLKKAQELIDCGVTFSAAQQTALEGLRGKVRSNFKADYLG